MTVGTDLQPQHDAPRNPDDELVVRLDAPLPAQLAVGRGTAVFVSGHCFHREARIASLALLVDGHEQAPMAWGMPRRDVLLEHGAGYRSGFWGLARIRGAPVDLGVRATLEGGRELTAPLARIPPAEPVVPLSSAAPEVAICMATHDPPPELFRRQIESIRAQTHDDWLCVISDDCSSAERTAELEDVLAGDPRFLLSRSPRRLGFYRNFERALALAPAGARYVAMADQDDAWHPDKLATLLAAIGDARLVYSDARIVTGEGRLVSGTYWSLRRNNHRDMFSLLVTNSVTGAASLFRRELLEYALPFPPAQFAHFHDHWVALCALAAGEIRYVDRPLYDYVQHGDAFVGHAKANRMPTLRERIPNLWRDPRERIRVWRMHYFGDACRLIQFATILELRYGERMGVAKRRALQRFAQADRSLAPVARLAALGARELIGQRRETLGGEWMLLHAFGWRQLADATAGDHPATRARVEATPPELDDPTPEARGPGEQELRSLAGKVAPLRLAVREDVPARVNLLLPTIDLQHLFGGYIAKFNLARRLAARGHRVRIVTVDPTGRLPSGWARRVESYSGLDGLFADVEIAFGREADALEVSRDDAFIATTWWTAHVADAALRELGGERFLYLIQEYEPFTFPSGSYAALAEASYRLPHDALFSTELLRDYFRANRLGVFGGDGEAAVFRNAITAVDPPGASELARRRSRRLLFYARPEPHAARNMFELGGLALARAAELGAFDGGWTLQGIGTVESRRRLDLGAAVTLELMPRTAQADYAGLLREHDVGLALMYTPHPSLVPLEMAAAGMLAVTNTFASKSADALAAISPNLIAAEPTVESIARGLCAATAAAGDVERRLDGSRVDWPRDWQAAFDDELMDRISTLLGV